jgi:hypothetical protein
MSKKFVHMLGIALGASGKSSRSHTRKSYTSRAPRQTAAQKREVGALLLRQEIERREAQSADDAYKELINAMKKDEGLMAACKDEAVKLGHKIYRERANTIFNIVHDFIFSVETNIKQENRRLETAIYTDDSLKDICLKEAVKRGHNFY